MKADFTNYKSSMNKLLKIKQKETCLLTVDMQNEYLDPKVGTSPLACLLYTSPSPRDS